MLTPSLVKRVNGCFDSSAFVSVTNSPLSDVTKEVPKSISRSHWVALCNSTMSKSASPYIVEVENAWKVYQIGSVQVEALRGVNMGVKKGEMVAVMGPSGCGKT